MPVVHDGYVQFGCGLSAPTTWVNFDASPTLRLQKIPLIGRLLTQGGPKFPSNVLFGDVVRGLPVDAGSCCAVYASHVLEHLSLTDFRTALRNVLGCLRPGGVFRFVVPDLEYLAKEYLDASDAGAAQRFMESTYLGVTVRVRGLGGLLRDRLGNSKHLWMWDFKGLAAELQRTGYTGIRRAEFGDSADHRIGEVEDIGRWGPGNVGVECACP